jgi:DNA-binding SARP family transcriptional activator
MLWPDLEEASARNSLSVCLHRLRAHLGRADAIVRDGDGYALHPHAIVDVWEIDRVIASVRSRESLSDAHRATLLRVWKGLAEPIPDQMERWEWFEPTARRLGDLRIEVAKRLAHDALERGDTRAALQFAAAVTVSDPCDEGGHEIAIRAHLLGGDRAAAMRQFRHYRETLFAELQVEPSPAIAALVRQ